MRILLIEDDPDIATQAADALRSAGFTVDVEHNGADGLETVRMAPPQLLLLDVMLPGLDGWSVCRALRRDRAKFPILMLTARDSVEDRVRGLEEGADDYLVKPFDARELVARARALLRRDKAVRTGTIQIGDLEVDTHDRRARRGGRDLQLTPREYTLLEALARNAGRTLTRELILESVWNSEENTEGSVNYHVSALRKKVDEGYPVRLIHTVHGFGYTLKVPEGGP
ncbi:MAG: response regulator transcription factor [Fimbriimonas sp.]